MVLAAVLPHKDLTWSSYLLSGPLSLHLSLSAHVVEDILVFGGVLFVFSGKYENVFHRF